GPDPLPWRIAADQLDTARKLAAGNTDIPAMTTLMPALFNAPDPNSKRVAAMILSACASSIPLDSPELTDIAEKIHTGSELPIRIQLVSSMAQHPQSPMVQRLLTRSFSDPDPQIAMVAMHAILKASEKPVV